MHDTTRAELTEALRLRDSKPGLSQEEVAALVSEKAHNDPAYLNPHSIVGSVVYQAYLGGIAAAAQYSKSLFMGIDMTEGF